MKGRFFPPRGVALLLLASLLGPVAWAGPTWADDFSDAAGPTDNPGTPEPDLYANWKVDAGLVAMPDLVASSQGAAAAPAPLPGPSNETPEPVRSDALSQVLPSLRSSRAPPSA